MSMFRQQWSLRELSDVFPTTPPKRFKDWADIGVLPAVKVSVGHVERSVDRRGLLIAHLLVALFGKTDPLVARQVVSALPSELVVAFETLDLEDAPVPRWALVVDVDGVQIVVPALLQTLVERLQRAKLVV